MAPTVKTVWTLMPVKYEGFKITPKIYTETLKKRNFRNETNIPNLNNPPEDYRKATKDPMK